MTQNCHELELCGHCNKSVCPPTTTLHLSKSNHPITVSQSHSYHPLYIGWERVGWATTATRLRQWLLPSQSSLLLLLLS